jgi:hypothetical protein
MDGPMTFTFGWYEGITLIGGALLYGAGVVWVLRNVYKDLRDDRQGEYETY